MLFNSFVFILQFLPIALIVFYVLSACRLAAVAAAWLGLCSVVFYGYWSARFIPLLLGSVLINYVLGRVIASLRVERPSKARTFLIIALAANLAVLGYYKYANFFIASVDALVGTHWAPLSIVLPIGISFFTFTQIAYLVDTYQGKVRESNFVHYLLFVTYFPHLIAGPVLHHAEMMPQFARSETYRFDVGHFSEGSIFFLMGLFKKVVLADGVQPFVGPVFNAPPDYALSGVEAWGGALAYTMQLYFDFSGYSDMAIGLSKLFNVNLPLNFNSPYKARNIIDFWRRWHMTLSRFLRDYLYVPLGGNRLGKPRRYLNLMITMLLGGLWHGAAWTFVLWGGIHGLYLVINHAWHRFYERITGPVPRQPSFTRAVLARTLTFTAVVFAWVFFRATSVDSALNIISAMLGQNGWSLPIEWRGVITAISPHFNALSYRPLNAFDGAHEVIWLCVLAMIAWTFPNSQEIVARATVFAQRLWTDAFRERIAWAALGSVGVSVLLLAAINASRGISEFIYFNF